METEDKVTYSRPPGWKPTPKPKHHHVLGKAGLKVAYLPWGGFVEVKYRDKGQ